MNVRLLIVRRKCSFCREAIKVVNKLNLRMEIDKKIDIIDAWEYEEFGLDNLPILNKLNKEGLSQGFPFLIIDSVIVEPAPTPELLNIFLEKFLEEDLIY